jgi:hypothetical protein
MICYETTGQVFIDTYNHLLNHFQDTMVSLTSSENTMIIGIENKVFVHRNLFPEKVNIQINKKFILYEEESFFVLHPNSLIPSENLSVIINNFKNDTLYYKTFTSENLPVPSLYLGHVNLSETKRINLNEIQLADSIYFLFRNSLAGNSEWLKIKQFTIGYSYGTYYIIHDNLGNILTRKTKNILLGMKPGQEVSIHILAEETGSITKELPLLYFKIY